MIDMHSHSKASDGSLSPRKLVELAGSVSLKALALTDHDTVDGLEEAACTAAEWGIRFIPGIEIEIRHEEPGIFHLLGLGITGYRDHFPPFLAGVRAMRENRNHRIIARMQAEGMKVTLEDALALSGGTIVSRPHLADLMVREGKVATRQEAFDKYLATGRPWYEPMGGSGFADAAACIHAAGGLAVMAHPLSIHVSWTRLDEILEGLKEQGLDGIEAFHPGVKYREALRLAEMARKHGLSVSAGSDYHGDSRPDRKLGRTLQDCQKIADSFLDILDPQRHFL